MSTPKAKITPPVATTIRFPGDLLTELDAWRQAQAVVPARTPTIIQAVRLFLANEKSKQ